MTYKTPVQYLYIHPNAESSVNERKILGTTDIENSLNLASIIDLRINLAIEKRNIEIGKAEHKFIKAWSGIIVVDEGFYTWDSDVFDYTKLVDDDVAENILHPKSEQVLSLINQEMIASRINFSKVGVTQIFSVDDQLQLIILVDIEGKIKEFLFPFEEIKTKEAHPFAKDFAKMFKQVCSKE